MHHQLPTSSHALPIRQSISGHRIDHLAARAGGRSFYAYDFAAISQRVQAVRAALPDSVQLYYSPKVNPYPALMQAMAGLVDGFDLASVEEMRRALDCDIAPRACLFTGPAKSEAAIRAALAAGVVINLESLTQLDRALQASSQMGVTPHFSFRLNPGELVEKNGLGRYENSHFGFDIKDMPQALGKAQDAGAQIVGFHGFFGSQFYDVEQIRAIQVGLFDWASQLASRFQLERYVLNLGGGFAVGFYDGEPQFDLSAMGKAMGAWMEELLPEDGSVQIVIELGRYLLSHAGYYVAKIDDVKQIGEECFVILEGGMNHNALAAGIFGRTSAPNAAISLFGEGVESRPLRAVSVAGPLCTSVDRFATGLSLPQPKIGDYLIVAHAGAYGHSFSPSNFLSHDPARELLLRPTTQEMRHDL